MKWILITLVVLSPAILYVLALILLALKEKYLPRRCPTCERRGLHCVNLIKATILIDGQRAPDHWSYWICDRCNDELKLHQNKWLPVPENERHHLTRQTV